MELTGRWSAALPLLIGASGAYMFNALTLKRAGTPMSPTPRRSARS